MAKTPEQLAETMDYGAGVLMFGPIRRAATNGTETGFTFERSYEAVRAGEGSIQ